MQFFIQQDWPGVAPKRGIDSSSLSHFVIESAVVASILPVATSEEESATGEGSVWIRLWILKIQILSADSNSRF